MIPLHDDQPTHRPPVVTVVIIAINCLVFIGWQLQVGLQESVMQAGLIPSQLTGGQGGAVGDLFTSMFMHGGWMHLIGNMWFLWIFGNNIEDAAGHAKYFLYYASCGVLATLAYVLFSPRSGIPLVGASGAISGVLGGYLVLHPQARVMTLIPLGIFTRIVYVPAFLFLLLWIGLQVISQAAISARMDEERGGVAYLAHIGGFVAGVLLIFLFRGRAGDGRTVSY